MYRENESMRCVSVHVYLFRCFEERHFVFYDRAGSIDDRRYLRHEILNEDIEYNVIVTT